MNTVQFPSLGAAIDEQSIRVYCDVLFTYLEGLVPIRLLSESGTPNQRPHLEFPEVDGAANRLIALATAAAERQQGVFVVPGTVASPGSARAKDITQTGVILVDLDHGDIPAKVAHLSEHLGPASLAVASGGITEDGHAKLHLYWRLTEAAVGPAVAQVAELRAALAAKAGGDPAFKSAHQPVRVAGTIHGKNGTQTDVRILATRAIEYELDGLAEAIANMPSMPGFPVAIDAVGYRAGGFTARDLATKRIAAGGRDGETRFAALSKVIGHWLRNARRCACTLDEAWIAVQDHNAAMIDPPWEEVRLRREFDALLSKDLSEKGPMPASAPQGGEAGDQSKVAPPLSDDAIAADFVARHGQQWKHVSAWGAWYQWSGNVWRQDEAGLVREIVRQVCRAAAHRASKPSEARSIASDKKMSAVQRVAAADPSIAVPPSRWDAYPMSLNTPSGVVDLETGEITSHDPELLVSQITTASPGGDCPGWMTFLGEITDGAVDLQAYLKRLAGYCLTGSTREQAFAFLHGHGANGKSVFLQTIASIMGTYAATATLDAFMSTRSDRHLTELAGLRAARLVLVSETEAGRSWAEARIKAVTGGEKVRANFMRQDHFEFEPQFKLLVAGNHRPTLNGVGEAMRRRLHLVPFDVTIPIEQRDHRLAEKLLAERDGILGWMLAGCADWQSEGLSPPQCIMAAVEDYFEAEDLINQWIGERCHCGPEYRELAANLFKSWKAWADDGGYPPGSSKSLGEALRSRGFTQTTVRRARGWSGIGVIGGPVSAEGDQ